MKTALLLFGITGDLMRLKGIPALFALHKKGLLTDTRIIGFSRKQWDASALRMLIVAALGETTPEDELAAFSSLITMVEGEGSDTQSFAALKEAVGDATQLVVYLCVNPELYTPVLNNLDANGFFSTFPGTRLMVEKPFGKNLASAQALEARITSLVPEEQVYRVDHYLAKEGAQALATLSKEPVASLELYLLETAGVEQRGAVYDSLGALRDVGQNHLLEMASLALGTNRAAILKTLPTYTSAQVGARTVHAQYTGYTTIAGTAPDTHTETYFLLNTQLTHENGRVVEVTLCAGKRLATSRKEVVATLISGEVVKIPLTSSTNEYETLFTEVLKGSQDLFVQMPEAEALWRFIDPIEEAWAQNEPPLLSYSPDTDDVLAYKAAILGQ